MIELHTCEGSHEQSTPVRFMKSKYAHNIRIATIVVAVIIVTIYDILRNGDSHIVDIAALIVTVAAILLSAREISASLAMSTFSDLWTEWDSDELKKSLEVLYRWRRENYPEAVQTFEHPALLLIPESRRNGDQKYVKFVEKRNAPNCVDAFGHWKRRKLDKTETTNWREIDDSRRKIHRFFHRAMMLARFHHVGPEVLRKMFAANDLVVLWQIVEPLNESFTENNRAEIYDWYREVWKKEIVNR